MKNKPQGLPKPRYIDRPEVSEIFADSLGLSLFDGQSLRLEFTVTRWDEPKPPAMPSGRSYPTARIVLTPTAAADLANRLNQVMAALQATGAVVKQNPPQSFGGAAPH